MLFRSKSRPVYGNLSALVFGLIGFADDYRKVRAHQNEGLTAQGSQGRRPNQSGGKTARPAGRPVKPAPVKKEEKKPEIKEITIPEKLTIRELADAMKVQPSVIVKKLFLKGEMVTVNEEIDFEKAVWNVPAQKMKKRKPHAVPLCRQCINYLKNLYVLTGCGKWVFPTVNMNGRPMSDNTVNAALH